MRQKSFTLGPQRQKGRSMIDIRTYDIEKITGGAFDTFKIYERYQAAMYLVCGRERACLVDTGFGLRDLAELTGALTPLPVLVVNTHSHEDHVLGNHFFRRALMHPADRSLYDKIVSGYAEMLNAPWVQESFGEYLRDFDPASVCFPETEDITDGSVIDLGGRKLETVGIPGHTAGSILLLDREAKLCFSGDAIIEHLWLFLEESQPPEIYLNALKRAAGIMRDAGTERIYNGHYAWKPMTMSDAETILSGMERIVAGDAAGKPFKNDEGSGTEFRFGELSVLCRPERKASFCHPNGFSPNSRKALH